MTGLPSVSKNRFDFVFLFSVYQVRWRSEEVRSVLRCFLIASEKGGVEDGMDFPLGGNAEMEHRA